MMKTKLTKYILIPIIFIAFTTPVYAVSTATDIRLILDPIIRLLNLVTGLAGFFFMAMLFYAAYKYAIAQGDPKMLQGAKDTLTHAIMGFIIAGGAFAIINWLANVLGIGGAALDNPSGASQGAIQELIDFISF